MPDPRHPEEDENKEPKLRLWGFKKLHRRLNKTLIAGTYCKREGKKYLMEQYRIKSKEELKERMNEKRLSNDDFKYTNVGLLREKQTDNAFDKI